MGLISLFRAKGEYNKCLARGGFWKDYAILISSLIAETAAYPELSGKDVDPLVKVLLERKSFNSHERFGFVFTQSEIKVGWVIETRQDSRSLNWSFDRNMDQKWMAAKISTDTLTHFAVKFL